ncbi:MAG: erythromycin esterase family protein, partial [Bdellovibrionota bacterium]
TWMWANLEVIRLTDDLRRLKRASFYGLDVYSLFESIEEVLRQLGALNPLLARRAREHYACFDRYQGDETIYARSLLKFPEDCEKEVLDVLQSLLRSRDEKLFNAQQNARIVENAVDYYRTMMLGSEDSWNVRDRHMMETLDLLLERHGKNSKAIVWAHNTHIGDYRATDMAHRGQINLGGLARQEWGSEQVALVEFGTYEGEVVASTAWDGPVEIFRVPAAPRGTLESELHEVVSSVNASSYFITLGDEEARKGPLAQFLGHRAIGVVYRPEFERFGNYVPTSLSHRYDYFVFTDRTSAVQPISQGFQRGELPETWPMGM